MPPAQPKLIFIYYIYIRLFKQFIMRLCFSKWLIMAYTVTHSATTSAPDPTAPLVQSHPNTNLRHLFKLITDSVNYHLSGLVFLVLSLDLHWHILYLQKLSTRSNYQRSCDCELSLPYSTYLTPLLCVERL